MKYCPECGFRLTYESIKFCNNCGVNLSKLASNKNIQTPLDKFVPFTNNFSEDNLSESKDLIKVENKNILPFTI